MKRCWNERTQTRIAMAGTGLLLAFCGPLEAGVSSAVVRCVGRDSVAAPSREEIVRWAAERRQETWAGADRADA